MMDIRGDNPQEVFALEGKQRFNSVHWSPDGQRLAYLRVQAAPDIYGSSIETCDLKGANRTVVVPDTEPWLRDFCWLPDGRIVYSRLESPDSDDDNLWQIGIDTRSGTPIGKAKRVTQWAGSYLRGLSTSADGRSLVFQKTTQQAQAYLGELAAGGTRMTRARRLSDDEAFDWPTAWTADSKAVLFESDRNGKSGIFKQGISQDTAEPVVTGPQNASLPRLSADGAWILYGEWPSQGPLTTDHFTPRRLMRIPVRGGVPQFVLETRTTSDYRCARAPASLCVVSELSGDGKQVTLTEFDPLKGRGKVLRTVQNDIANFFAGGTVSPDGTTFAHPRSVVGEIQVRLLSLSGEPDREFRVKGWPNITGLDWSPDSKGLYVGSASPQSRTLLYVDLKGNARVLWQFKGAGGPISGVPSPDGRYLAFIGAVSNSNVWMLEGF
jgi:Tol biopolymer transport system component